MRGYQLLIVVCLLLGAVSGDGLHAQENSEKSQRTIDAILDAWKTRQNRVDSFQASWKHTVVIEDALVIDDSSSDWKVERFVIETIADVVASGDMIRIESNMKLPTHDRRVVVVCKGETCSKLQYANAVSDRGYCQVTKRSESAELGKAEIAPLQLFFRPFQHPLIQLEAKALTIEQDQPDVGYQCVVLRIPFRNDEVYRLFVENDGKVFPVRRMLRELQDGTYLQRVDIKYRSDATLGLVPAVWRIGYDNGALSHNITAFSYSLTPTIAPEAFDLELPVGTHVRDWSLGRANLKEYDVSDEAGTSEE